MQCRSSGGITIVAIGGLLVALGGCPGSTNPIFPFGETDASTGERPGITTFGGTIDPSLPGDTSESMAEGGGSTAGTTTMGPLDDTTTDEPEPTTDTSGSTTDVGSATDSGTTSVATTDPATSTGMMGGSTSTGMGGSTSTGGGESTSTGGSSSSTGMVCHDVSGNYENCVDMAGAIDTTPCNAPGTSSCLTSGAMPLTGGVCAVDDCVDECDCPDDPVSGNAVVSCSDVTGDPMQLFCNLDCSMGETCPTGMVCFGSFICLWPTPAGLGEPYGDCFNNPPEICGFDGTCLNDNVMAPTIGVCTTDCPGGVGDCDPAPPGGASPVACADLTGDGADECFLDCLGGAACPPGMNCFANICVWS